MADFLLKSLYSLPNHIAEMLYSRLRLIGPPFPRYTHPATPGMYLYIVCVLSFEQIQEAKNTWLEKRAALINSFDGKNWLYMPLSYLILYSRTISIRKSDRKITPSAQTSVGRSVLCHENRLWLASSVAVDFSSHENDEKWQHFLPPPSSELAHAPIANKSKEEPRILWRMSTFFSYFVFQKMWIKTPLKKFLSINDWEKSPKNVHSNSYKQQQQQQQPWDCAENKRLLR